MQSKKIRVSVDIRDLKIAKTGARTYLKELCTEFAKQDDNFEFIFIGGRFQNIIPSDTILGKMEAMFRFLWWKQIGLPVIAKIKSCKIIFCTDFFVPLIHPGIITIPVFHDAFIWEYPSHYSKFWHKLFNYLAMPAAKKSPYIIVPTKFAQEKIAFFSGITKDKIIPIYEAAMRNEPVDAFSIPTNKPYILHVGTFEIRKNLPTLINAYTKLIKEQGLDYDLVLVGQSSSKFYLDGTEEINEAIEASGLSERIHKTGYITDGKLEEIYKRASLYVFPSLNEGFGIPVVEAFSTKVPLIISNNSCLPEIAGDAALAFDPNNTQELYKLMKKVLTDSHLQQSLINKGTERAKVFNWENTAKEIKDIFKKAVNSYL